MTDDDGGMGEDPPPGLADDMGSIDNRLPGPGGMTPTEIVRLFTLIQIPIPGDDRSVVTVAAPDGWTTAPFEQRPLSTDRLVPLALFEAPDRSSRTLQLQGMRLVREMSALHWLKAYCLQQGYALHQVAERHPLVGEAFATFEIENNPVSARFKSVLDGDRVFLAGAIAPEETYDAFEARYAICLDGFAVRPPSQRQRIEPRSGATVGSRVSLTYPTSWMSHTPERAPEGKAALDLLRMQGEENLLGRIRIKAVERSVPARADTLVEEAVREHRSGGFTPVSMPLNEGVAIEAPFNAGVRHIFEGRLPHGHWTELAVTVAETPTLFVVTSVLSPHRAANYPQWAINTRTVEIVLGSLDVTEPR